MITSHSRAYSHRPGSSARRRQLGVASLTLLTVALLVFVTLSAASAQQSFKTAEAAVDALVNAAKSGDQKGILTVLGPDGAGIASSGDNVEDTGARKRFTDAYDAKHQINMEGDQKAVLMIGEADWPFPIPIVRKDDTWRFDTAAGRDEILYRRIGGYYYEILTRQGPAAPGGAYDYLAHGKMIGGFALVAYPAVYRSSGVMTFLVNHEGRVFEKDLGPRTADIAEHMTSFNPDDTWKRVTVEASD